MISGDSFGLFDTLLTVINRMMTRNLAIFGSGEIASLARFYFENDSDYNVVAFTVDDGFVDCDMYDGLPLIPFSEFLRRSPPETVSVHVALSYRKMNQLRQQKYEQVKRCGYLLPSYISSRSVTWSDLNVGDNCFLLENQTIQPTVRIGNNVVMWSGNHVGHGTTIGDHTYISSHVCLSGHCVIGERCFFGVNSSVRDFTKVGNDVFVAMQVGVTTNLESGAVVLGHTGKTLSCDDRRAKVVKRKFFGF